MIEETKSGQNVTRDVEYWKNLRISLAKNGVDSFADSLPKLKEVMDIAAQILQPVYDDKQAEFAVSEVLIPTARVLVGLQIPEAKEDSILPTISSSLEIIRKSACVLFTDYNLIKAAELILMIFDMKKPLYRQDIKKAEPTNTTMPEEASPPTKSDLHKPLLTINEVLDEDQAYKMQDVQLRSQDPQAIIVTVKRAGYKQLFSKIAQTYLSEMGNLWQSFQTRTPEFIDKYLQILASICKFIHYQYLRDLFQLVRAATLSYFQNAEQARIRNVTKELFQSITGSFEKIFNRLILPHQKIQWCDYFLAEATLPLIRCRLIKSKLTGTKIVSELSSQITTSSTKALKQKDFKDWLIKNQIFQQVFKLDNHQQLIQQGSDILKFLIRSNGLTIQQLQTLLNIAQKGDLNVRKHIMKTLSDLTIKLDQSQFECIIQKMAQMPGDIFSEDMIEIISDMCKYSVSTLSNKGMQVLWNLISNHYQTYRVGVQDRLLLRFTSLLKCIFQKDSSIRPEIFIDQVIKLFYQSREKKWVLELLRKIIDVYPTHSIQMESAVRILNPEPFRYLLQQREFHKQLLKELENSQSKKNCQQYLSFLSYLFTNAKLSSENQLGIDILLKLTKYPKTFSQCLHYFSDRAEQLLTLAASQPINSEQKMQSVWELFVTINKFNILVNVSQKDKKYDVNCLPNTLRGYHKLLEILVTTLNPKVRDEVAGYLAVLHCNLTGDLIQKRQKVVTDFIQNALEKISFAYKNQQELQLLGYCSIVEEMMNETEKRGVGKLVAHSSLVNTQSIKICITNEVTYGIGIYKKLDFKFPANKSLYEMLSYAGTQFKCSPDDIFINDGERQVKQRWNGLSLEDIGLHFVQLTAHKRNRQTPKANLLDTMDQLTPRARQVFTEIFHRFSPSGKMTAAQLVNFVQESTHDSCALTDSRISETFDRYDDDKDGILSLKNFLDFYQEASKSRQGTVWRNLDSLQYRSDLSRFDDVREVVDYHNMARYILYKSSSFYDILFELSFCNKKQLRGKAIRLLKRLPTSPKIIQETLQQVGFNVTDEFLVWYKLTLILSFLMKDQNINVQQKSINDQDVAECTSAAIALWRDKFIGSQQFAKILEVAEKISTTTKLSDMSLMTRHSLSLCLQILRCLNNVPYLNKPFPQSVTLSFLSLSCNKLAETLLPQLYQNMIIELFEPVMCFLLTHKALDIVFITPGLFSKDEDVRRICNNFLYLYQRLHNYSINVFQIAIEPQSKEFYETVVKLIQQDTNLNLSTIFKQTYNSIKSYPLVYTNQINHTLMGKIKILDIILLKANETTDEEFQKVLLRILHHTANPQTRQILYTMLLKTSPLGLTAYIAQLTKIINPQQNNTPKQSPFVGITNLGCICYMNSMLQQFFMTPEMRYPILGMPLRQDLPIAENKKGLKYVDNLIYQLQKMFGYLSLSARSQYNPEGFCYAYKSDIALGIQEDAHQFLNRIFSQMEDLLKGTCFAQLLNDVFGGTTIVTITCKTCNNYRYRVEQFKSILLGLTDSKSIDESFSKFTDSEIVSDVECQSCKMKVKASTKQTHLHTLPNTLIIQLGRIALDMSSQNFESIKLHSRLEFPFEMNLSKYVRVQDNQRTPNQTDCEYQLKGIVIHSGTAAAGHYYSIIKVAPDTWFKFDDSRVSQFNISELPEQAYGGRQEYSDWATQDKSSRSKNAFVLLYDKKKKASTQIKNLKREDIAIIQKIANISTAINPQEQSTDQPTYTAQINSLKQYIVQGLKKDIDTDNIRFFHQLQFNHEFFVKFVVDIIKKIPIPQQIVDEANHQQLKAYYSKYKQIPPQTQLLYKNTHKMIENLGILLSNCSNPNGDLIKELGPYLYNLQMAVPLVAQEYFMSTDTKKLLEIIVANNDNYVRELYRMIANKCINIMIFLHDINLQSSEQSPQKQKILEFLDLALSANVLYTQIPKHWSKCSQYFDFWRWFCYSNPTSLQYCFEKNMICLWIDLILEKKSPIKLGPQNYTLNNKYSVVKITPLLQTLSTMILASHPIGDMVPSSSQHFLTPDEQVCLTSITFYKTMIEQKQDFTNINYLITTLSRGNLQFSEDVAGLLLHSINQTDVFESAMMNIMLINGFMLVKDNLVNKRLQWIFGVPQYIQTVNEFSIKNSLITQTISYVSTLYFAVPSCKSILELLFSQRKSPDNFSVSGVNTLLSLITSSEEVLRYVLELPPPSYVYASYIDWIDKFIDTLKNQKYLNINGDREKMAALCEQQMSTIRKKMVQLRKERGFQIQQPSQPIEEPAHVQTQTESMAIEHPQSPPAVEMHSQQVTIHEEKIERTGAENPPSTLIVEEKKPVLLSLKPFAIIGRNFFIQQLPDIIITSEHTIRISPAIYYTYVCQSLPVGDNNLSLKKELFEYHTNYDISPLKYFVFKETDVIVPEGEIIPENYEVPQSRPTIINLKIETNTCIIVDIRNPEFKAQIYLPEGTHQINVPFTEQDIQKWVEVRQVRPKELIGQAPAKKEATVSSYPDFGNSGFMGPYTQDYYQQQVSCQHCSTFNHPMVTYCSMCGLNPT